MSYLQAIKMNFIIQQFFKTNHQRKSLVNEYFNLIFFLKLNSFQYACFIELKVLYLLYFYHFFFHENQKCYLKKPKVSHLKFTIKNLKTIRYYHQKVNCYLEQHQQKFTERLFFFIQTMITFLLNFLYSVNFLIFNYYYFLSKNFKLLFLLFLCFFLL